MQLLTQIVPTIFQLRIIRPVLFAIDFENNVSCKLYISVMLVFRSDNSPNSISKSKSKSKSKSHSKENSKSLNITESMVSSLLSSS